MKTHRFRTRSQAIGSVSRGFTLVELLVVIAMIIVLAALIFGFAKFGRERARAATCVNNVKQICAAQAAIVDDTGGYFVTPGWTQIDGRKRGWPMHFTVMLTSSVVYRSKWSDINARVTDIGMFNCPTAYSKARRTMEDSNGYARWNTYALNYRIGLAQGQTTGEGNGGGMDGASRPEHLSDPALTICVSEAPLNDSGRYRASFGPWSSQPSQVGLAEHHNKGFHVGYMDGHVVRKTMETFPYIGNTMPDGREVVLRNKPRDPNEEHWSIVWRGQRFRRDVPDPE